MATALEKRAAALERLRSETFDLMVVGAGIIGARVALEAALTGARVALVEARDFGSATSSASSKLIHGGLRYLQLYDFALVREAHRERRVLQDRLAPHLVRPLTLVLPVFRGAPHRAPTIAAGMLTYAALSGFRHSSLSMVGASGARHLVPSLRTERLVAAAVYQDAQTHDSRLVLRRWPRRGGPGRWSRTTFRSPGWRPPGGSWRRAGRETC
jgi:glycerol-3-phosphate dehydrogenase